MNILKRLVTQNWELCIDIIRKFVPEEEFNNYVGCKADIDLKTLLESKPKNERHFHLKEYLGEDLFSEILVSCGIQHRRDFIFQWFQLG